LDKPAGGILLGSRGPVAAAGSLLLRLQFLAGLYLAVTLP